MTTLFLVRSLNYGGQERQLVALASGLHERGRRVAVAVFQGGPLAEDLDRAGVPIHDLGRSGRDLAGVVLRLARVVRAVGPQVVHGYGGDANLLVLLMRAWYPCLKVVWGVRASALDLSRHGWRARLSHRLNRAFAHRPDLIIANSRAGREHMLACGYPGERVQVISNGIDTARFRPDAAAGLAQRAQWGLAPSDTVVGLVGRLDEMKDHPTFLRACALAAAARPDLRFVCVGDGPAPYRAELQRLAGELGVAGAVTWAPSQPDVTAVYNALDVVCSSSTTEGFPNVVGEAMACGVPCIVTDVGDSAWIVANRELVCAPGDGAGLARRILALAGDDEIRRRVGASGRERVVQAFSLEVLVETTERALAGLSRQVRP